MRAVGWQPAGWGCNESDGETVKDVVRTIEKRPKFGEFLCYVVVFVWASVGAVYRKNYWPVPATNGRKS